jgi:glycosyltransferase involved in cell wall biosynthesis
MPAYAAQDTLRESVDSVLAQTVGGLELIVVDDGSPLPVSEVLAEVRDPRLRIVCRTRNGGSARARNSALRRARAPVICQLDADDVWEPRYLEAVLPAFADSAVGLVYANATIIGHPTGHEDYVGDPSIHPRDGFPELLEANPIPCPTVAMRTGAVRAVGGYAGWLRSAEDWDLYLRLAAGGWRFAYVHERLAGYRWPEPTRGLSYDTRRLERWVIAALASFALRHPRTPGVWPVLRARIDGYRRGAGR